MSVPCRAKLWPQSPSIQASQTEKHYQINSSTSLTAKIQTVGDEDEGQTIENHIKAPSTVQVVRFGHTN